MRYGIDIMICGFDYYIGFIDCVIWLLVLDRIDGRNWNRLGIIGNCVGRFWEWWEVVVDGEGWGGVL